MNPTQIIAQNAGLGNSPNIYNEVKRQTDCLQLARELGLHPNRSNQIHCLYPDHEDKNPSFTITPNGFYCYGCHRGGSAIDLVMLCKGYDHVEAAKFLAERAGIPWPNFDKAQHAGGKREIEKVYDYRNEDGSQVIHQTIRYKTPQGEPKKFSQRRPDGKGDYIWSLKDIETVPYRLPELIKGIKAGEIIFIPEGEKDCDNLAALDLTATTNAMGAGNWQDSYNKYFAGAKVVILPDNDVPGRKHAERVANSLTGVAESVKVLELPGLPEKGDVTDWLEAGGTKEELLRLAEEALEWKPTPVITEATMSLPQIGSEEPEKLTTAQILIQLAVNKAEFFKTPEGEAYATFPVGSHKETSPIKQQAFKSWLRREFYNFTQDANNPGKVPGSQSLQDALSMLEAHAVLNSPEIPVFTRVGEYGGKIYLDLANDAWEAIEITSDGWRVVSDYPVKFRRPKGMLPLPVPTHDGNLEMLRQFMNVGNDENWILLLSTLLAAFWPDGPFPVLCLLGREGTGKSITIRVLRSLIDPAIGALRPPPREERDHAVAAANSWVLTYDNVSYIPDWFSDALCRTATGGGLATRKLYTDDEQALFDYKRPVILTGITEVITRNDLLDRAILLDLPKIEPEGRKDEKTLLTEFEKVRPGILGALLDAAATGLKNLDSVRLESLPRMADFAKWVVACEPALSWKPGCFIEVYEKGRAEATERAVEADLVAAAIRDLVEERGFWEGTATELLAELEEYVPEKTQKTKAWPKAANILSRRITRAATALERVGIKTETGIIEAGSNRRLIRLESGDSYEPF